jgi:hypothetical protein
VADTSATASGSAAAIAALRLDLANQGIRLGDDLLAAGFGMGLALDGTASSAGGASEGIDLILPGDRWINVSVAPGYARTSPYTLACADCERIGDRERPAFVLRHRSRGDVPITLPDTSRFRHARTPVGLSCGDIGAIHGRWVVIAPVAAVPTLALDRPRRFLGLPPQRALTKSRWSVDDVVACVEAAFDLGGARLVHLEASHLLADDGGVAELSPYIAAIRRAVPTLVSVSVLPPATTDAVLGLYHAGADAVAYHLLAWNDAAAQRVAPARSRFVSRERTMQALIEATRIFPRGAVSTDLLVGLEALADLDRAIDELTALGIVPNLALFRPLPGAEDDAPGGDLVATEPLLKLMEHRRAQLQATGLWHSSIRGFPRALAGIDRYAPTATQRWYAATRRWLRVEEVQP